MLKPVFWESVVEGFLEELIFFQPLYESHPHNNQHAGIPTSKETDV